MGTTNKVFPRSNLGLGFRGVLGLIQSRVLGEYRPNLGLVLGSSG